MGIVAPGAVWHTEVFALLPIMTFLAGRDYSFLMRRVFFMALHALEIFQVAATFLFKPANYIAVTCRTPLGSGLVCPDIYSGFVRAVAGKTVGNLQEVSMLLVTVCTLVVPALLESVTCMTVIAILSGVSAGEIFHVNAGL